MSSNFLCTLRGQKTSRPPFWFMRQAGRYLPEYRELRASQPSFLSLCYNPELAAEVTLQPLRRFGMDAAILFSDILVVPDAMGVKVEFLKGEGPKLERVQDAGKIAQLKTEVRNHLSPVAETIKRVRLGLAPDKSLIGFCGSPWTVACYMVEGSGSKHWEEVRIFAQKEKKLFAELIEKLIIASADYLCMQIEAGAQALQLFDSWAGALSHGEYANWVIAPTKKLVGLVKAKHLDISIIGFARCSGANYEAYARETGVDMVGIDMQTPMEWAAKNIALPLQGNLDPILLATDGKGAVAETKRLIEIMRDKPFVFNLGHGMIPQTPLENVMAVCETIRANGQ